MRALSLDDIRRTAPSVFATEPWQAMSPAYRLYPTSDVVEALMGHNFVPVRAEQSRSRIPGKENFTKHMLRFRHTQDLDAVVSATIPEIVLMNSHDGASAYSIGLGLYRVRCQNGLVVQSAAIQGLRVRHSGKASLVQEVIEASYRVIEEAPIALAQVETFQQLQLSPPEQEVFAEAALELHQSAITVTPAQILQPRRGEDGAAEELRDLWRTFNTVQENMLKGDVRGQNAKGRRARTRRITSVGEDTKLNRSLWMLAERMAELKGYRRQGPPGVSPALGSLCYPSLRPSVCGNQKGV